MDMRWVSRLFLLLSVALLVSAGARAEPVISGAAATATSNNHEIITLSANAPLKVVRQFVLNNPDRIVVDMQAVQGNNVVLPEDYNGSLISTLRFGRFNHDLSRLVIEVNQPAALVSATPTAKGLTIDITEAERLQAAPARTPTTIKPAAIKPKPGVKPAPVAATAAKPEQPSPAVQTEEAKPLVVIDAGHGGQDPGAISRNEVHEKDITLAMALAVKEGLLRTGRYRVALTREDDHYILLPERVAIARKLKGDLFISLHADSNPLATARGLSIYTLSETASDAESQALAERENKSDIIGGLDLNTADKDVASILIDLTQRETADKSAALADSLLLSMGPQIARLEVSHRYAGFRVLKAPDIPSVLIELGFLSNSSDEKMLQSDEYREAVVASIIKGIDRYRKK